MLFFDVLFIYIRRDLEHLELDLGNNRLVAIKVKFSMKWMAISYWQPLSTRDESLTGTE